MRMTMENKTIKKDHWVVKALDELYKQITRTLEQVMDPIYHEADYLYEECGESWDDVCPHAGFAIGNEDYFFERFDVLYNSIVEYYRKMEGWK